MRGRPIKDQQSHICLRYTTCATLLQILPCFLVPKLILVQNKHDTVSWTWDQPHGFILVFLLTMCQPANYAHLEFLGTYQPSEFRDEILERHFQSRFLGTNSSLSPNGVFVWFSPFHKILFMNRLEFSCFTNFLLCFFIKPVCFLSSLSVKGVKSASRRDCDSLKQFKT